MTRYDDLKNGDDRLAEQAKAEFEFAQSLEENGYDTAEFMRELGLSVHQFNVLAHYIYGVNDEEPMVTPQARALIAATRRAQWRSLTSAPIAV